MRRSIFLNILVVSFGNFSGEQTEKPRGKGGNFFFHLYTELKLYICERKKTT